MANLASAMQFPPCKFICECCPGRNVALAEGSMTVWEGYLERDSGLRLKAWAESQDVPLQVLHTSGHASPADLKRFVEALDPKVLVPIHSSRPECYAEVFPRVEAHKDGEFWEIGYSLENTRRFWNGFQCNPTRSSQEGFRRGREGKD